MSGHCQNLGKSIQVAARVDLAPPPVCPLFQRICFYRISLYFLSDLLPRVILYLSRHVFGFFKAPFPIGFLSIFYWICSQEKFYICHNMTSAVESTGNFYSIEKHIFLLDLCTANNNNSFLWWHTNGCGTSFLFKEEPSCHAAHQYHSFFGVSLKRERVLSSLQCYTPFRILLPLNFYFPAVMHWHWSNTWASMVV